MGTPHLGVSSAEIGENLVKVASVFIPANSKLLEHLRRDSEFLREQLLQYGPISTDFETVYFYEAYATKVGGVSRLSFAIRFGVHEIPEARCFVGRKKDLVRMRELLQAEGRLILTGLGGIGKTTLAAAYASKYKDTYSAVFWLNAKDTDSLKQSFLSAAKRIARDHPAFQIDSKSIMEIDNLDKVVDAVKSWLDKPGNTKWLLIYDSHDTPKLPDSNNPEAFDIKSFLPDINKGAIIITTTVSRIEIGHHLSVDKLTKVKHSLAILSHASGRQNLATDPDAEALALEFDGLPLALATAGAYLHEVTISCAQYLLMYRKFYVRLQQLTPNLPSRPDRKLYSTWDLSFAHFRTQKPDSANLLRLWAYFDNQDIWFELLEECKGYGPEWFSKLTEDELSFHDAARVLCNYGLIKADLSPEREDTESKGYSMHNCVHSWTIHVLNQEWDFSLSKIALYRVALHCARARKETNFSLQRRLLQHANRCTDLVLNGWGPRDDHEFTIFIIVILGEMYMDHENLHDAERSFYWAMEMYKTLHGEDDERTLQAMQSLSNVCKRLGKLDEASSLLWDILRVKSKKFPAKHESTMHESTIETRGHFASVLMAQGKLIETEITCYIALVYGKPVINSDLELYLLTILGCLREKQGRLDEAEDLLQRVLDELLKKYGDEDFSTLGAMHNLANVYVREGRFADAEKKYKRILRAREKTQGMKHNDTLDAVNKLGVFYLQWKKLDEAEAKLLQALKVREEVMGAKHLSTLKTVSDLGEVYAKQRKFPKAEEHYQRALDGYESVLEPDHAANTYNLDGVSLADASTKEEIIACFGKFSERDSYAYCALLLLQTLPHINQVC
ncbi:TPR-like protein [Lepidopterella palustris CBS 459.81]|uniref:TPR-like protein n=1 Tax=Lepidopterella palustris CBS 459.81 TaxID=1314670 RepID=A0A8E2E6P9_9PEZI|nr:TPR-like protein [Lepidopterella palustris CBS 459.81]